MEPSPRFEAALTFAVRLHANQRRKGKDIPYVAHLLAVTALVIEHGGDEDEAIAALLHDAVEDQGGDATLEAIRTRFGDTVAAIVEGCTDSRSTPKPPWKLRKERYLAHLPSASESVRLVSAADKLHNARSVLADYRRIGAALWPRFRGARDGTLWYYQALLAIYHSVGPVGLAEELGRTLDQLLALMRAADDYEDA